jgi:hypothetical protein
VALALAQSKISFEVHLPKLIGSGSLKPLPRGSSLTLLHTNQSMAMQDIGDRAGGWQLPLP